MDYQVPLAKQAPQERHMVQVHPEIEALEKDLDSAHASAEAEMENAAAMYGKARSKIAEQRAILRSKERMLRAQRRRLGRFLPILDRVLG